MVKKYLMLEEDYYLGYWTEATQEWIYKMKIKRFENFYLLFVIYENYNKNWTKENNSPCIYLMLSFPVYCIEYNVCSIKLKNVYTVYVRIEMWNKKIVF